MYDARVNGIKCKFFYDEVIPQENAPTGFPNRYYLRHDEDNWIKPISIEPFVFVNFFGTVFMKDRLEFDRNKFIEVRRFSFKSNLISFKLSKDTMNKMLGL